MKYNIKVYVNVGLIDLKEIILPVEYQSEYILKTDISKIGVNGVFQKMENKYLYYPPTKIEKIIIEESD